MKNFLKGTILGSLLFSLLIHLGLLGSVTIDWHLAEQWYGLKAAISQIKDRLDSKSTVGDKAESLVETAVQEVSETVSSLMKGEKLRLGPDAAGWKKLDEQIATEKAQAKKEAQEKDKKAGGGKDTFSRFISPPMEIEIVEAPPKAEMEKGAGIEMAVEFKKEECSDHDPKVKTYGGIGLQFSPVMTPGPGGKMMPKQPLQFQVSIVPKGYPADKAGLIPGDVIEGDPLRFRGEIGSPITVQVVRNGRKINFNMNRVKICYEAPPVPPMFPPDKSQLPTELNFPKAPPKLIPDNR